MLYHEMLHAIISISILVIPRSIPYKTRYGFDVMHIMKDYNFYHITTTG